MVNRVKLISVGFGLKILVRISQKQICIMNLIINLYQNRKSPFLSRYLVIKQFFFLIERKLKEVSAKFSLQ